MKQQRLKRIVIATLASVSVCVAQGNSSSDEATLDDKGNVYVMSRDGRHIRMTDTGHCAETIFADDRQTVGCLVAVNEHGQSPGGPPPSLQLEIYLKGGEKKMIEAGACALQIENQVSDEKQCGHQDGKVTVPHEVFLAKIRACRHAFLELGVEDGIVVTRTDSLGAGLTQQIAVSHKPGDLGDQYNSFLDCEEVTAANARNGDVIINRNGKMMRPKRLASNLYQFRAGTGEDRCVLDCITSLQNGADLLWIETEKPHIEQIAKMVDRIREVIPNAKLAYNNSPSFNWTLNFRWQVYDAMKEAGKDVSKYNRADLMKPEYDDTPLAIEADERIRTFQADSAKRAGIFHHLITLPTYHTAALSTDNLAREYFGEQGMLGYVKNVQRQEIRQGIACVKHQNMAGSDIGDVHKEYFAGESALKAGGAHNTMNQFG